MNDSIRATKTSAVGRFALFALAALMLAVACVFAAPASANALEVAKCTAKPNAESGNDVMGATETRITWEGRAGDHEQLAGLSFTMPQGTEFSTKGARVTQLSGEDLMTREPVAASFQAEGDTLFVNFDSPLAAGAYVRVEIYQVFFPAEGGALQLSGSYDLVNGASAAIEGIPTITVASVTPFEQLSQYLKEQPWVQAWNSNKFCKLFLDPTILVTSFPVVFWGFLMALGIVACAFPLAIPVGFALSLMRMSKFRVLRGLATTYVNVVRGTPLFLQIYIAFFGLPLAGVQIPPFPLGVIVLLMNSGAYLCEIFRAGIQSINKGQFEAARSLGMNGAQTMLFVIVPQTIRRVIPTMTSEFILLYKDTSLLAAVGVMEVVMYAKTIVASTGSITPYIVAACFYLVITLPLAKVVGMLEARLAGVGSGKKKGKKRKGGIAEGSTEPAPLDIVGAAAVNYGDPSIEISGIKDFDAGAQAPGAGRNGQN